MKLKYLLLIPILFFGIQINAQVPSDLILPVTVTVATMPPKVTLTWTAPSPADTFYFARREKGVDAWSPLNGAVSPNGGSFSLEDNTVTLGNGYEYFIFQEKNASVVGIGLVAVGVDLPVVDARGTILLLVESALETPLSAEILRLEEDLIGDGWRPQRISIGATETVTSVKTLIKNAYAADPTNVKSVLLLGKIPVPYSGSFAWDGHPEHNGAWPADAFYADMDGNYTDATVNLATPARPANVNIPGDGKFDQNQVSTPVELQIGRVDFSRLTSATFGKTPTELMKRYLDKDHNFRVKSYVTNGKALIDDNFGWFGGEAFSSAAYRMCIPMLGSANIENGDFFTNTATSNYLYAYGCGGGSYNSANGVGTSADFGSKTVNAVFTNIFGSYHGDWDFETDPFLMSALGSNGGVLTTSWSGRPSTFTHTVTYGEPIGYAMRETQNVAFNTWYLPVTIGESGLHATLLGDPTLRTQVVEPIKGLSLTQNCNNVEIGWNPSSESDLVGYLVYRATQKAGPYTKLSVKPQPGNAFLDENIAGGTYFYNIKTVKRTTTPGGGSYLNTSTGAIREITVVPANLPIVSAVGGQINCTNPTVELVGTTNDPSFISAAWSGPNGYFSLDLTPNVSETGTYTFSVISENGCLASTTAEVTGDFATPSIDFSASGEITCANPNPVLNASITVGGCVITGANGFIFNGVSTPVSAPGTYTAVVTGLNGCTNSATLNVNADTQPPILTISQPTVLTCTNPTATLTASSTPPNANYLWSNNETTSSITVSQSGSYSVVATNPTNGCSASNSVIVTALQTPPVLPVLPPQTLTCTAPTITLPTQIPFYPYQICWSGGNIPPNCPPNPTINQPGTYTATVTDPNNGCTNSTTITIDSDGNLPQVTIGGAQNLTCLVTQITLTAASSTVGSTFSWSAGAPNVTNPGTYSVVVTSPNGCTNSQSVTISEDIAVPVSSISSSNDIDCTNTTTTLTATSSIQNSTFVWTNGATTPSIIFPTNPSTSVTVTAPNGCSSVADATITQNTSAPSISYTQTIDCQSITTISLLVTGSTAPFTYQYSPVSFPNIPPNTPWSVIVTGANGCSAQIAGQTGIATPPLTATATSTPVSGSPSSGTATVQPAGGTAPYEYLWSNGATAQTATGLDGPLTYSCTVTDAKGCETIVSVFVDNLVGTDNPEIVEKISLSPNPTSDFSNLFLELKNAADCRIEISAADGRIISQLIENQLVKKNILLNLENENSGIYFIKIKINDEFVVRKISVLK
jgi:hypothetical protein